jgi:hypothetical protein
VGSAVPKTRSNKHQHATQIIIIIIINNNTDTADITISSP